DDRNDRVDQADGDVREARRHVVIEVERLRLPARRRRRIPSRRVVASRLVALVRGVRSRWILHVGIPPSRAFTLVSIEFERFQSFRGGWYEPRPVYRREVPRSTK